MTDKSPTTIYQVAMKLPIDKTITVSEFCEIMNVNPAAAKTRLYKMANVDGLLGISKGVGRSKLYSMSKEQKAAIIKKHEDSIEENIRHPDRYQSVLTESEMKEKVKRDAAEAVLRKAGIWLSI